ncbi:MAG: hypothetical protein WEB31_07650 [Chthoniobacterales bacterium]
MNSRLLFLALGGTLLAWGAWHIYSGWGLVTIDADNVPLERVLGEIRRQGGIEIVSDLSPDTKVSLRVRRVPAVEALDITAVRTGANWRLAYLGAPDTAAIEAALSGFGAGRETAGWTSHQAGGFSLVEPESGRAMDLREMNWTLSGGGKLSSLLQEGAEKTGVFFAAPASWQPEVAEVPPGTVRSVATSLFRQAGGVSREVFLLRGSGERTGGEGEQGRGGRGAWIGAAPQEAGERGGGWMGNPERLAERVEAQIALLPAPEQPKAREDFQTMREFWTAVRDLPEEERRDKAREFFNRPDVQERMEDRRLARWAKMTPDQRIERCKSYWERKSEGRRESR